MTVDTPSARLRQQEESTAVRLLVMALTGEDGTARLDAGPLPTLGYWVGGRRTLVLRDLESVMLDDVRAFVVGQDHRSPYYGVWTDSQDGAVYLDAVDWVLDEQEAIALAVERAELAIWDIQGEREIRTYDVKTGLSK